VSFFIKSVAWNLNVILFFSKDMWTDYNQTTESTPNVRSAINGLAHIGTVCGLNACAIAEELGGLTGIRVITLFNIT
jgi:hypothetical protein